MDFIKVDSENQAKLIQLISENELLVVPLGDLIDWIKELPETRVLQMLGMDIGELSDVLLEELTPD